MSSKGFQGYSPVLDSFSSRRLSSESSSIIGLWSLRPLCTCKSFSGQQSALIGMSLMGPYDEKWHNPSGPREVVWTWCHISPCPVHKRRRYPRGLVSSLQRDSQPHHSQRDSRTSVSIIGEPHLTHKDVSRAGHRRWLRMTQMLSGSRW